MGGFFGAVSKRDVVMDVFFASITTRISARVERAWIRA